MVSVPRSRYWCFGILAAGGLATDLLTKTWVFSELGGKNRTSDWSWTANFLWGRFEVRLTTVFNEGALFGIGQGLSAGCSPHSASLAAAGIVYWLFVQRRGPQCWWLTITLGPGFLGWGFWQFVRSPAPAWMDDLGGDAAVRRP